MPINLTKEQIEARRPKEFTLTHKDEVRKDDDDTFLETCAAVAYYYNQYTLEDVLEMRPNVVYLLLTVAQKKEAEFFLTLNAVINGPNAKSKSTYKKVINNLAKIAKS